MVKLKLGRIKVFVAETYGSTNDEVNNMLLSNLCRVLNRTSNACSLCLMGDLNGKYLPLNYFKIKLTRIFHYVLFLLG